MERERGTTSDSELDSLNHNPPVHASRSPGGAPAAVFRPRLLCCGLLAAAAVLLAAAAHRLPRGPGRSAHGGARLDRVVTLEQQAGEGTCSTPKDWCSGTDTRNDTLSFRDCDGDGILDPYCEGGFLLRFGYISSKNNCEDNWPAGLCRVDRAAGKEMRSTPKHAAGNEITIIHFNDVYNVGGVLEDGVRYGGMSRAMHLVAQHRKRNPNRTFVVFAGDCLSPSVLSDMFHGEQMVDVLNSMEIDAASLGNHEFDFGIEEMTKRLNQSRFPWLNVNLMNEAGELLPATTKYLIREVPWTPMWKSGQNQTAKICFFGVAYDVRETMFKDVDKVTYKDVFNASKEAVQYLKRQEKCDVVIPLTHQFSAQDCELSRTLGEDVDLILGGHDHSTEFTSICGHAPFVKAASDLKTQWIMTLWLGDDGKVSSVDGDLISLTDADPFHPAVHDRVVSWEEKAEQHLSEHVGCFAIDVDAKSANVRRRETELGNFATDAVRGMHFTEVALINGGTLRGDKVYPAGDALRKMLLEFHPFGNQVAKIYASGSELKDYINTNLDCWETTCGDFVHVSGLKYRFDSSKPQGKRLVQLTTEDGTEVGDDQMFTVAITDYMLANSPFRSNKLYKMTTLNDAVPLVQAFVEAVGKAGGECVEPKLDGRIQNLAEIIALEGA